MNIVICEDDPIFAKQLQNELHTIFEGQKMQPFFHHVCKKAELFACLQQEVADLFFMDIRLGDEDGVELVRSLREENAMPPTIFLTSMEDRIVEGFDVHAFYFLFKRDYREKLPQLIDRFLTEVYMRKTILVRDHGADVLLDLDDIYYVEPDKRNTSVHTAFISYLENVSIQSFARNLPGDMFVEVYHSLFVNVDHIRRVDSDFLVLDNEKHLPVSRRKRGDLMSAIMRRIQNR